MEKTDRVFILRCWAEQNLRLSGPNVWRYSLENARTGERSAFTSLEALTQHVAAMINKNEKPPQDRQNRADQDQKGTLVERSEKGKESR